MSRTWKDRPYRVRVDNPKGNDRTYKKVWCNWRTGEQLYEYYLDERYSRNCSRGALGWMRRKSRQVDRHGATQWCHMRKTNPDINDYETSVVWFSETDWDFT